MNQRLTDIRRAQLDQLLSGGTNMAGGGTPKKADSDYTLMGAPRQENEHKPYPKTERMNLGVKAIKSGLDSFNRFIDQGPSVRDVLGNVVGAVPFVGPDLRKGMEESTLTIPYGFERSPDNPKVATGVQTAKVPTTDILDALKMSDITGGTGASNLLGSVGKGYAPDPMDVLDTLGLGAAGYGVAKAGAKGVKGVKDALLAGKEAKAAKEIETAGTKYATQQEGPFFRVQPTTLGKDAATTRGTKEADGLRATPAVAGGAEPTGRKVPQLLSPEEVGRIIADPVANQPLNIAKKYTKDTQGADFGVPNTPSSSLAKQSGIARTFDLAVQGSPEYKSAIFGAYSREMPDLMEQIGAKNYDDLMEKAYRQMAKETDDQFKRLPYNFSYHRAGEGNYNGAKDMAADVHGNRHLYVYQGGDKHDFLHNVDPQTGLNENEKFRAVHDLLGHAIYGNEFGPKGEEMAWAVHQQMYSPLARMAMTAETRGQNSVVNYSPLNAKLKKTIAEYESLSNEARRRGDKALVKEIEDLKRQAYSGLEFAPNKAVLLPPEFMNPQFTGGMPLYLKAANRPTKGTETGSVLTHYSNEPNLQLINPTRYGTGIKGAEAERLMHFPGGVRDRSYFYLGEPGAVAPETGLGGNRYRGESSSLYDITQDPLDFRLLAREANRTPFTARANAGVTYPLQEANDYERLVKEYGYEGMINPNATKPMGIMFEPTKVEPNMAGGGLIGKLSKAAKTANKVMPTARIGLEAPGILIPSKMNNVREAVRNMKGNYGARRVERAADEIPNLERMYREEALRQAFTGDNAKGLMTINPADFERYATPLMPREKPWPGTGPKKENLPTDEYVNYLAGIDEYHDVPFLEINKQEYGLPLVPFISGHEGRHRNRAMAKRGEKAGLVQLLPRSELREPFPRRSQEEYLQALRDEMEMTGNVVVPQPNIFTPSASERPAIDLSDIYAKGGEVNGLKNALNNLLRTDKPEVHMGVGGAVKAAAKAAAKTAKAAYSPKVLNSTIDKFVAKIAADNPKLSEEDVLKKATKQATSKLEWERVQKPELEKTYGPLVKTPYSKTNVNKMQNTAEIVAERKRKANEFLDQPTEPWTPPAPELQAFDRSSIKDALEGFPGVDQTAFPRDIPTRASTSHVDELYADPENRALIEKQIKRGLPLGGETFYASLYPVKQAVLEAGMPAEKFDRWIHSLAPASARNSIMNEMAVGQFMRDMNARGIPLTEENVAREMAVYKEKFGVGLPLMPLHREGVAKVIEGGQDLSEMSKANIPTNYKIPTYGSQKAGDFANSVVLDVHEAGGQTQGSRFHPYFNEQGGFGNTEYNAGEQGLLGIARDLGIPGGMAQAGRWFGGGELTGLRSPRGDALDLLEKQVAYTLNKKGIQPNPANVRAEVLRQIETGEGDLLPWYRKEGMPDVRQTGLQRKEGGEVTMEGGLTHCKTKKVKRHGNTVPH